MSTPWQPSNCLKELILDTGSQRHAVIEVASGMGCRQEDVEWSNRQSENSSGSSFHLFVCSQAVFSPVKTKFNLHPFIHCYSPLSASAAATPTPKLLSASILPLHVVFLFSHSYPLSFVFLTTPSATSVERAQERKTFNFILLASGTVF